MADTAHVSSGWDELDGLKFADEETLVGDLLDAAPLSDHQRTESVRLGRDIVKTARAMARKKGMMESFLEEFGLSNQEGLALMCLAEALLRVPDAATRDKLIAEKIRSGDWSAHSGQSDSWLVNASTWGLMLTGRVIGPPKDALKDVGGFIQGLVRESGEPVIRTAMLQAMRIMGEQFVLGRDIEAALKRGAAMLRKEDAASFSFDMLGEGARTHDDAARYFEAYKAAIDVVGDGPRPDTPEVGNGVSVKLSALHPRYDPLHEDLVLEALYPRLLALCESGASKGINVCLDAEEADRLVLSLRIFERLAREPSLEGWAGLGLAVQAYQKRAGAVIERLASLSEATGRRFMVRLVKGAYWDTEIKHSHVEGHPDFPVFTTKDGTDLSYLACARRMLAASPNLYSQFATHNAHTLCAVRLIADELGVTNYEFQRLHGMGEALYSAAEEQTRVRVYAPVGAHKDLLPYLVRRLLENGANTSFVNSFLDDDVPVEDVVDDPIARLERGARRHLRIPVPPLLYGPDRRNAAGTDLTQTGTRQAVESAAQGLLAGPTLTAGPIVSGKMIKGNAQAVRSPSDTETILGMVSAASETDIDKALDAATAAQSDWDRLGGAARADILRAMGQALEDNTQHLIGLMAQEAGKTLADGIAEVREAVDFCRYYALEAERQFAAPTRLPGPAGETNHFSLHGRGVFACISPWNFPLAIFTGQIAAALAAGNTVVAKPAEQTILTAFRAVQLFQKAGLPKHVLHLLPGDGATVGAALTRDLRVSGVAFTGSTGVAKLIARTLAERDGPIAPLIAETGGLNAMFVDTTALREQVIDDVIVSAFGSAGQRCSALRLLFLPKKSADDLLEGLMGAMDALRIGAPSLAHVDVGPVIDAEARSGLEHHLQTLPEGAKILKQVEVPGDKTSHSFFPPTLIELRGLEGIDHEVFGPILHVCRYDPDKLEAVGAELRSKGYGLTLGIHSRLERFARRVQAAVPVGNTYVNRSMTGAVVGVQPFGGEGLSGTGPKAGGPHYLPRFAVERTVSVNIAAQGGDPELLSL